MTGLLKNGCHEIVFGYIQYQQVLTQSYSLHDLRSVGTFIKHEFNTANMAQCTLLGHGVNIDLTFIMLL